MLRVSELRLPLDHAEDELAAALARRLGITPAEIDSYAIYRRNHDARNKAAIMLTYTLDVAVRDEAPLLRRFAGDPRISPAPGLAYRFVAQASERARARPRPVVVGTGPCGLFAGLILAQMGYRPLILERGKPVRERTRDAWALWRRGELDPESNVQFGEGGAGTFSDGKLHSLIKDPHHHGRKVLAEFVRAGAPEEILYLGKPHIGTFRLVGVVEKLRATITGLGGEIRFRTRVDDLVIERGVLRALITQSGQRVECDHAVLAVGHSARDTFAMLAKRGVHLDPKPFSIGLRIEHPQSLIDRARFGSYAGHPRLGAADYKLVHHCANGRAVYSFCMCPGGTVVAAASEPGGVVTNGMSQYSRNERNANSALVVGIDPADYPGDALAGVAYQRRWEEAAYRAGGGGYAAPGQRVDDFLAGRPSTTLGTVIPSYRPGVNPGDLSACLPDYAIAALREAIRAFGRQISGFAMADAVLTGVETRTSAPLRIRRDASCQSIGTEGLYPAGEGAGYAGGILSAAVNGIRVAEAVALDIERRAGTPAAAGSAHGVGAG